LVSIPSILTNPYPLAHMIGFLSEVVISIYIFVEIVKTRERRLLLSLVTFLIFALSEFSLVFYYWLNRSVFLVYAETTVKIFGWFLALSFLLLSSAAVATLAVYLMEFRVLYLVPTMIFVFVLYVLFYTYYLFRAVFLGYIRSIDIIRITVTLGIAVLFVIAIAGEALFSVIYRRTKSLRVLSFIIGTTIMGFINLGGEFLLELLPMALVEEPLEVYKAYLLMMEGWSLNILYMAVTLILLLGQTKVLDAVARFRGLRVRREKSWIERMMEEA